MTTALSLGAALAIAGHASAASAETKIDVPVTAHCSYVAVVFADVGRGASLDVRDDAGCRAEMKVELNALKLAFERVDHGGSRMASLRYLTVPLAVVEWNERFADCLIARYGHDSRPTLTHEQIVSAVNGCGVYRELDALVRPHGLKLAVGSLEKIGDIDFRTLGHDRDGGYSVKWVAAHKGYRGRLPAGAGKVGFKLTPTI